MDFEHRKFQNDWIHIDNGPLERGLETSFNGTGLGAKGLFKN